MVYESNDMLNKKQAEDFIKWFSDKIGTDYELNASASGEPDEYYIMFFDLETNAEYDAVKAKDEEYLLIHDEKRDKETIMEKYRSYDDAIERIYRLEKQIKNDTKAARILNGWKE